MTPRLPVPVPSGTNGSLPYVIKSTAVDMNLPILERGRYLGATNKSRATPGLLLTLCSYEPNRVFGMHVHEHPGFFLLLGGQHLERDQSASRHQDPLTAVFHKEGCPHATETGPTGMLGLNISFDRAWLAAMDVSSNSFRLDRGADITFDALKILSLGFKVSTSDTDLESAALELLVPLTKGNELVPPRWLRTTKRTIENRFAEKISLRGLAAEAAVHPNYLARIFRQHYGCSVYEHLHRARLAEATRMLQEGSSIGQAAAESGFSDQAHLTRICNQKLRLTPGELRKLIIR